jgi:hypothetical protein
VRAGLFEDVHRRLGGVGHAPEVCSL